MKNTLYLIVAVAVFNVGCGDTESRHIPSDIATEIVMQRLGLKSVSLPDDLPDDIPIYPDARTTYVGAVKGMRQAPSTTVHLETTDSVEKVHAFFGMELRSRSWEIEREFPASYSAKKGKRYLHVYYLDKPGKPGTTAISVTYNRINQPDVE